MIDIEDNSSYDIVQTAEEYFKKANSLVSTIPDKMVYGDVFVYLPSMIARYYIDHYDNLNETDFIFRKVTYYLDKASTNAETLSLTNYEEGLFHQGEIMHNRGFFYAKSEDFWSNGINAYNDAISLRTRLYNLTKYPYYEPRIAQSKVNLGELQLQILKKSQTESNDAIPMSSILCALDNSQKAMDIYQRHILVGNMNSERPYYEALQLNATILDFMFVSDKKRKDIYDEMISKYSRCWEWNKANPTNSYRMTFIDYSGRRLLEFNVISIGEFNSVLTICKNAFNN
jgi:tetratricopeptide (TPR) repeat protein